MMPEIITGDIIPAAYMRDLLGPDIIVHTTYIARLTKGEPIEEGRFGILKVPGTGNSLNLASGYGIHEPVILVKDLDNLLKEIYITKYLFNGAVRLYTIRPVMVQTGFGSITAYDIWLIEHADQIADK